MTKFIIFLLVTTVYNFSFRIIYLYIHFFSFSYFYKLLAACCQGYEHDGRLDTMEKASAVEVGEDVRET